jgi:hypothetical protein
MTPASARRSDILLERDRGRARGQLRRT